VSTHFATVLWVLEGDFAANRYSREHRWRFDGGVEVPASSSPLVVPVPMANPAAVDPEEALVASAASCHMLWFLHRARDAGFAVRSYHDDARGMMGRDSRGRIAMLRIELRPRILFDGAPPSTEALARLHREAHESCFIANSLRSEVIVVAAGDEVATDGA
jgi:organic hydroperoxide reductase OsmC/OhrA